MWLVKRRCGARRAGRRLAFSSEFAGGTVPLESRALTAPAFFRTGDWLVRANADAVQATPGLIFAGTQSFRSQTTTSPFGEFTYSGGSQIANIANDPGGAVGFTIGVSHASDLSGQGNVNPAEFPFTTGSSAGVNSDTQDAFGNGVARYQLQDPGGGATSYDVLGLLDVHFVRGAHISAVSLSFTSNQFDVRISTSFGGGTIPSVTLTDHATGQTFDQNALLASGDLVVSSTGFDLLYQQTVAVPVGGEERVGYTSTHTDLLQMSNGPEGSPQPNGFVSAVSQSQFVWAFDVSTVI
jgi:hypothetical protein